MSNTPNIDWTKLDEALEKAMEPDQTRPDGDGWFTAKEYADERKIHDRTSYDRLEVASRKGMVERTQFKGTNYYRLPV